MSKEAAALLDTLRDKKRFQDDLARLRKARAESPLPFFFTHKAQDKEPLLYIGVKGRMSVKASDARLLRTSSHDKARICQGLTWIDPLSRAPTFAVVIGDFQEKQFLRDMLVIGRQAGRPLGRVSVSLMGETERARIGKAMVAEVQGDNQSARIGADEAMKQAEEARKKGHSTLEKAARRRAAQLLGEVTELSPEERAHLMTGAGARQHQRSAGRLTRFAQAIGVKKKGRAPEPPTEDERWAFQTMLRDEHVQATDQLRERYRAQERARDEAGPQRGEAFDAWREAYNQILLAKQGKLEHANPDALGQRLSLATEAVLANGEALQRALGSLEKLGAALLTAYDDELDYTEERVAMCPSHEDTARGWRSETQRARDELAGKAEAVKERLAWHNRGLQTFETRNRAAQSTLSHLGWTTDERAQEERLIKGVGDSEREVHQSTSKVVELRDGVEKTDTELLKARREHARLVMERNDLLKKTGFGQKERDLQIQQLNTRLGHLAEDIDRQAKEKQEQERALLTGRREVATREDSLADGLREVSRQRGGVYARQREEAEQRLVEALKRAPGLKKRKEEAERTEALSQRAATELREARGRKTLALNRLMEPKAEVARLSAPNAWAAGASNRAVLARKAIVEATAELDRYDRLIEEVRADATRSGKTPLEIEAHLKQMSQRRGELAAAVRARQEESERAQILADGAGLLAAVEGAGREVAHLTQSLSDATEQRSRIAVEIEKLDEALQTARKRDTFDTEPTEREILEKLEARLLKRKKKLSAAAEQADKRIKKHKDGLEKARIIAEEHASALDRFQKKHAPVFETERRAREAQLEEARRALALAEDELKRASEQVDEAVVTDRSAQKKATNARKAFGKALEGEPEIKALFTRVEATSELEEEALASQRISQHQRALRVSRDERDRVLGEALSTRTEDTELFAEFRELEDIYQAGRKRSGGLSLLDQLSGLDGGDGPPDPEKRKRYEAAVRTANRIINQIERLKALGEDPSEYLRLLDPIPRAFWPDRLVEEVADYVEISKMFQDEDDESRMESVRKQTWDGIAQTGLVTALDVADVTMNVSNLVATNLDAIGEILKATGVIASTLDTVGLWKVISAMGAFSTLLPGLKGVLDKAAKNPEDLTDEDLFKLKKELDTSTVDKLKDKLGPLASAGEAVDFLLANFKGVGAMPGALVEGSGVMVPGLGIFFGVVNTAVKANAFRESLQKSVGDHDLHEEISRESGKDSTLSKAMHNRMKRTDRLTAEKGVDVVVGVTNTIATTGNTIPGGTMVAIGAWATAATIDTIKKIWFATVDWRAAARAQDTLKKARLGSRRDMLEVFDAHQKYATMLLLVRAREGNNGAIKFCMTRGLNEAELDSETSLKVLRQYMLEQDGQSDQVGKTFTESASKAWDVLCKGARIVGAISTLGGSELVGGVVSSQIEKRREEAMARRERELARVEVSGQLPSGDLIALYTDQVADLKTRHGLAGTPEERDGPKRAMERLNAGMGTLLESWERELATLLDTLEWRPTVWEKETTAWAVAYGQRGDLPALTEARLGWMQDGIATLKQIRETAVV